MTTENEYTPKGGAEYKGRSKSLRKSTYWGLEQQVPFASNAYDSLVFMDYYKVMSTQAQQPAFTVGGPADFEAEAYELDLVDTVPVQDIEGAYRLRNRDLVISFLERHPHFAPLLLEVANHIVSYFPDAKVALEVVPDPEIRGHEDLVAFIRTSLDVDDSFERLQRFDEEWFLEYGRLFNGSFIVMTESV